MKKGNLIFWEISNFETTKEELIELGLEVFIPRNDYKSAMIKALHKITRGNERLYRRFNDNNDGKVSFGLFQEVTTPDNIEINKELIIKMNKITGHIEFSDNDNAITSVISDEYERAKRTINSSQFRTLVLNIVKANHGVSLKKDGGVYFVDEKFKETVEKLKLVFNQFPSAKLHVIELYNDPQTLDAIEFATSSSIFKDIEKVIKEVRNQVADGSITKKILSNRTEAAAKILEKIRVHEDSLRSKADELKNRLGKVVEVLDGVLVEADSIAMDPEDFMDALAKI